MLRVRGLLVKLKKYAAASGMRKLENAQSVAGPQNELVKSRKRSGILTGYGLVFKRAMAGMVNAYLFGRSSGRKWYSSNKTIKL